MKLGKLPYVHQTTHLHMSTFLPKLPPVPSEGDWGKKVYALKIPWGMDLNDKLGCCGVAGMTHAQKLWIANSVDKQFVYTEPDIITVYSFLSGYNPKTGKGDSGIALIQGLKYWQKFGFNGHKIDAYMLVDPKNQARVNAALYLFGALYAGVGLPITASEQIDNGKPWTVQDKSLKGDSAPYSWGGHCVVVSAWNVPTGLYKCVTWGTEQSFDAQFLGTYFDELWAPLSLDFFTTEHKTPSGFMYKELMAQVRAIQSNLS